MVDFSRLSTSWVEWMSRLGMQDIQVSTDCDDCHALFSSRDYSVHLRGEDGWWVVDIVNDRRQRTIADAKLSTFELAEKYLIWKWVTQARSILASGPLGAELYKQGYAPGIDVSELDGAHIQICLHGDCAILMSGTATIFSHIMLKSVDQIEQIARQGLTS
jgi:hypothetical protein